MTQFILLAVVAEIMVSDSLKCSGFVNQIVKSENLERDSTFLLFTADVIRRLLKQWLHFNNLYVYVYE